MASLQPGRKGDNFNVNSLQRQGMLTRSKARENPGIKRLREEEVYLLEARIKNSLQNKKMLTGIEGQGIDMSKRRKEELDPLLMEDILEKVLGFLDVNSLKAARQVSKLWSAEGAKILITKCYVSIPKFPARKRLAKIAMTKFKTFLSYKQNDVSMVPNITVKAPREVKLWKSVKVLGPQVKSLKLTVVDNTNGWFNQLLGLLPNLKYLSFQYSKDDWSRVSEGRLLLKLLTSLWSKVKKNEDSLVISRIVLPLKRAEDLEEIEKFSEFKNILTEYLDIKPELRDVERLKNVPQFKTRLLDTFSKLLSTSKNILQTLSCTPVFLHLLDFPCMTALRHMNLHVHRETPEPFIQHEFPSFQFSENFPNLFSIAIFYGEANHDSLLKLLKTTGISPSVKRVQLAHGFSYSSIYPLFQAFPNIEEFELCKPRYWGSLNPNTMQYLWKNGTNLRTVHLNVNVSDVGESSVDLEAIFTGFLRKVVKEILNSPKSAPYTLKKLDKLRVKTSILNLTRLEHLQIDFYGNGKNYLPNRTLGFAGKHAFQLLQKDLKILIHVKDTEFGLTCNRMALDEISKLSNVTITLEEVNVHRSF